MELTKLEKNNYVNDDLNIFKNKKINFISPLEYLKRVLILNQVLSETYLGLFLLFSRYSAFSIIKSIFCYLVTGLPPT